MSVRASSRYPLPGPRSGDGRYSFRSNKGKIGNVRVEADRSLAEIEHRRIRGEADQYNRSLSYEAETAVSNRRTRLLANQGRAAALGIPSAKRPGTLPRTP